MLPSTWILQVGLHPSNEQQTLGHHGQRLLYWPLAYSTSVKPNIHDMIWLHTMYKSQCVYYKITQYLELLSIPYDMTKSYVINPLMVNDAFKCHKRFYLLEKGQFSQEKVQTCENHQMRRADFGKKNPDFFGAPPALVAGFKGAQPLSLVVALVWLLHGHGLHQFVSLGRS